jgi:chemotaxis protein histidine kinase CheA
MVSETESKLILNEIKALRSNVDGHTQTLNEISKTLSTVAVQSNRIDTLYAHVSALAAEQKQQDRMLRDVQRYQASCPRDRIEELFEKMKTDRNELFEKIREDRIVSKDDLAETEKRVFAENTKFQKNIKGIVTGQCWAIGITVATFSAIMVAIINKF